MSIRTRIFLAFSLVVTAAFAALVLWIRDDLRPRYLESLEEPLIDTAHVLAEVLARDISAATARQELHQVFARVYSRRFRARVYALERDRVDLRVYVTDRRGIVLFDSDGGRDEGRDYSRWNDVYRALRGEYGARSTRDDRMDPVHAMVYVAAPILVDGRITGVVSVGKPKRNVDQFVRAAQQKILVAGLIAGGLAILFGFVLSAWVARPLQRLTEYAQSVKAGRRTALPVLGRNEIGLMGTAMEEMRTALEGKEYVERYVQTLTHELKSPLAAIRASAELLGEDMSAAERQRFLANIRSETQRVEVLVAQLLMLASVEKKHALENRERVSLNETLAEVCESLHPLIVRKGVSIRNTVGPDAQAWGDRFLLRQALSNLLQNALEFSPQDGEIEIDAACTNGHIEISIRDHGPGVPEYALPRVFDRFYSLPRPDGSRKGTGLGLTFVHEVALLHGGQAGIRNHTEGGAIALLRLPLAT